MSGWRKIANHVLSGRGVRMYQREAGDGHLTVLVGQEAGKWYLGISHRLSIVVPGTGLPAPGRLPTWEEIREARYRFLPDDLTFALLLPPSAEYVNLHPTTMHLWELPEEAVAGT